MGILPKRSTKTDPEKRTYHCLDFIIFASFIRVKNGYVQRKRMYPFMLYCS